MPIGPYESDGVDAVRLDELHEVLSELVDLLHRDNLIGSMTAARTLEALVDVGAVHCGWNLLGTLYLLRRQYGGIRLVHSHQARSRVEMLLAVAVDHAGQLADERYGRPGGVDARRLAEDHVARRYRELREAADEQERSVWEGLCRRQEILGGVAPRRQSTSPSRLVASSVPVSIYVADDRAYASIEGAVTDTLKAFDLEVVERFPEIRGSVFRAFVARTKRLFKSEEMQERYAKIGRAVELKAIDRAQAEVDSVQSAAVARLITALDGTPDAIIQIGSVLLIKANGVVAVRNLTQKELSHLDRNPDVFRDPAAALRELQRINHETKQMSGE